MEVLKQCVQDIEASSVISTTFDEVTITVRRKYSRDTYIKALQVRAELRQLREQQQYHLNKIQEYNALSAKHNIELERLKKELSKYE